MTCIRWSLPLLAVCLGFSDARAHGVFFPGPYAPGYYSARGAELHYFRGRRSRGLAFSLRGFTVRGYSAGPLGLVPVTFLPPPPVTVVVVRRPIYLEELPIDLPLRERRFDRDRRIEAGDPPDVPGPDEVIRVPRPDPPLPMKEPAKKEELKPRPKEAPKAPPKVPRKMELPRPPEPDEDTRSEHERLLDEGREAFQVHEYGRAAMRFRRAGEVEPATPLSHFLLAQALLAQGKYHEASDAIHAGMARAPNWPASAFQPLALYGPRVADYPAHLKLLAATLERHPRDPVLLFLSAYHLWFDGRKEEAGPLFRRALPGAADPGVIDRFLRALPPAPEL